MKITWASWETKEGFGFKIPFTSRSSALDWLSKRGLLPFATLECEGKRESAFVAIALHRKLPPGLRRFSLAAARP